MGKIEFPDKIFGRNVDGAMERVLKGKTQEPVPEQEQNTNVPDTKGFIYVPSINLSFAEERSHQNVSWNDTHKAIIPKGYAMPTPMETWGLINYLRDNLSNPKFRRVYDDILKTTTGNTWHGEWQNSIFSQGQDGMYIQKVIGLDSKGELVFSKKERLESCLEQDGWADISGKNNLTSQGLCKTSSSSKSYSPGDNIYFYYPRADYVARFDAYSGRADLYCYWRPGYSYSSLGVRLVVRPKGASAQNRSS